MFFFIQSVNHSHNVEELPLSQKQAVITLIEKKDKDNTLSKMETHIFT